MATLLKAIHVREDREAVLAKAAQVVVKLEGMRLGQTAELVRAGVAEPLPDEYDHLTYAKNDNRPQLLEQLAQVFPRHVQIHYGRYCREELPVFSGGEQLPVGAVS